MIQGEERGAAHANTLQVDMQHDTNPRQALYKIIYIHSLSEACRGAHAWYGTGPALEDTLWRHTPECPGR